MSACRRSSIHLFMRNWRITLSVPLLEVEPPAAFPADDVLLLKSLKRPAIEAVRFNGTGNPVLAER
jgi:hypothetical protein